MHLLPRSAVFLLTAVLWIMPASVVEGRLSDEAPAAPIELQASPTPTPSPSPSPIVTPIFKPTLTVEDLQSKIRQRLFSPSVRRGRVGVKIVSLATGKVIFEQDSEKYFMPASNMKNFTVAAALERLTPDFRIVTSVYASAMPDAQGILKGDIRIFGRGDVSISGTFNEGDPYKGVDNLADKIIAAGVKRIEGGIIGDESHFTGNAIPGTWEWDDLQWYYGAEISALQINDGAIALSITPGTAGYACTANINPPNTLIQIVNLCTTSGSRRNIQVTKRLDRNILEITGNMPVGDSGFRGSVSFSRPADLFVALLKQRLEAKGVTVAGGTRLQPARVSSEPGQVEIARLESPPLSQLAARTMKPSQNMYTETLLWTLGEHSRARTTFPTVGGVTGKTAPSSELGVGEVKDFLKGIGLAEDAIVQFDGSGLSRHNLVTPAAVTALYIYMARQSKFSQAWRDSLTIAGVDGTLANRFRGTSAAANMRGKTGTIDQVSALSGYVTTAAGEQLVLSIIVNGVPETASRTSLIDDIVVGLANFNGRIDQ